MVVTRSMSKMEVSNEYKNYFDKLVEPLPTKEFLIDMIGKFKAELVEMFEEKLSAQNELINQLEAKVNTQAVVIKNLQIKSDDNESYMRRSCLRVHNVEIEEGEDDKNLEAKIEKCFQDINVVVGKEEIDRYHRIGKTYKNRKGKTVKSIIIKFKSWETREKVYKARPKNHIEGGKKPGFSISLDLTKRRYNLLKSARESIIGKNNISYVFADRNCSLAIKFKNGTTNYFNSKEEMEKLI